MAAPLIHPPKARPGDRVAVLSPSFAAPAAGPAVHEQALRRLTEITGLIPVEYPTTRRLGADARDRAADVNAAFADPEIRAVLATVGGEDQITVVPHLDPALVRADPKPFLGYSDNTNMLCWLWNQGVAGFYGGSTQVHLGAGPAVDPVHRDALRAALLTGERLELTEPGESEDFGLDWKRRRARRTRTDRAVDLGRSRPRGDRPDLGWLHRTQWILTAGRFEATRRCSSGVLLLESSEELIPAREFGWILRSLGERDLRSRRCRPRRSAAGLELLDPPARGRTGQAPGRAAGHRDRDAGPLRPGRGALCRGAVRPHPTAVDRALRRRGHRGR